jgi:hypothetical protein
MSLQIGGSHVIGSSRVIGKQMSQRRKHSAANQRECAAPSSWRGAGFSNCLSDDPVTR